MDDIQERLEHYKKKDRERRQCERLERETEIVQIDLWLFVYSRTHETMGEDFYRKHALLNALILNYGKTYGTKAQERLKEWMDDVREEFKTRVHELEEEAEE